MRLTFCLMNACIGALLLAAPNFTRRELLFSVPVSPDFRNSTAARHAITFFRAVVLLSMVVCLFTILLAPMQWLGVVATSGPLLMVSVCALAFVWQHQKISPAAVPFTTRREVTLTNTPERLPKFAWLSVGVFAILGIVAWWLHLNWSRIPAHYPVHFDIAGHPNRWAERTTRSVYGPILFCAELCAWFLLFGLASWFGSRRSELRSVMLGSTIAVQYFIVSVFCVTALQPSFHLPVGLMMALPIVIIVSVIAVFIVKLRGTNHLADSTPNESWKGGIFYYNPNDAVLLVPKRSGLGYTFNFANHWSWVLLLSLCVVLASAPFILA